MQYWEYRVVSFPAGGYTAALNEYGREGWELVTVTPDVPSAAPQEGGRSIPMPRMVGRLEDAAAQLNKLGDAVDPPPSPTTGLLWVLRRPVDDGGSDDD
jgi:hypothetical protein